MKRLLICLFVLLAAFWVVSSPTPKARATSGAFNAIFAQTTSALTATPNVRICLMTSGAKRDLTAGGGIVQAGICDARGGYYLGKKLTVPITGAFWYNICVDQDTQYSKDGSATNYTLIKSGTCWSEPVR